MQVILPLLMAALIAHAFGWGARGHMAIARVAFNLLSDKSHRFIAALNGANVDINKFAQMSLWADRVRDDPAHSWSRELHYTHASACLTHSDNLTLQPKSCILSAVQHFVDILNDESQISAATLSKKEALLYLIHFVGDLHAPFHIGDKNDMNGINTHVSSAVWRSRQVMSLHYFWDQILDVHEVLSNESFESSLRGRSVQKMKHGDKSISEMVFEAACEARAVTVNLGLVDEKGRLVESGSHLSRAYFMAACPAALDLIDKAGMRLARIIDDVAELAT